MKKRIAASILAVAMLLQTVPVFAAGGLEGFTDYAQDLGYGQLSAHWAKGNIEILLQQGGINGYPEGDFRANREITAAELIAMLLNATGHTVEMTGESWAESMLLAAYETGLCRSGQLKPEEAR